ncbi:uncharacterized protein CELE_F44E2.9 [Caenorhabditis elegans]|uniref:Uncharacterized protein F44E2.9 n=1 Tax=Caenorhabditis elegans TaxID=6239 RepID=YL59_CAEEL|nr:Uncharacterized protein CELE_F44E2.9 [Caenorhabditis elegans]Q9GQ63.1 RecName: Full=Uncharacterized protein F44E2.9 [Caenorhabditis elegans]AAG41143.1 3I940 [Caenorhabditis elegans]CCD71229.1 Uncharacterized protein CELE_F44E2.9 [Caenorhabditis elegans]|eukprot:NP_498957.1 Uncharacterized protein CELE_F44E2.9 [Caenorhabditis elegans]
MFSITRRLLSKNWKFLPNRERIVFKNKKEAFFDFVKVSGANILWQIGLAVLVLEFAFPTPDIVYDLKRLISPDFDLFCKSGNLVDFEMDFENKLRSIRREEIRSLEQYTNAKSPEAKFGGII